MFHLETGFNLSDLSDCLCYYCYFFQEMVNLVITGKAMSNTFDNTLEIDTGGAKKVFKIIITLFEFIAIINERRKAKIE